MEDLSYLEKLSVGAYSRQNSGIRYNNRQCRRTGKPLYRPVEKNLETHRALRAPAVKRVPRVLVRRPD